MEWLDFYRGLAVLVMVESGAAGGKTCAPIAGKVYKAIQELESSGRPRPNLIAER